MGSDYKIPDPVALLVSYHAAIQRLDFDAIETMIHPNAEYNSAGVGSLKGRSEIMAAFKSYFEIHGDQIATDTSVELVGPHTARAIWELRATNCETGKISIRSGTETIRFDASGLIAQVSVNDD